MSSELFMSCCPKDVFLHPRGWGNALPCVRQGIDATWCLGIHHVTCMFLDLNLKLLCPGAMARCEVLTFESLDESDWSSTFPIAL